MDFEGPTRAMQIMRSYKKPWYVAAGWALDLYLDHQRRDHADLDIATYREDQLDLQKHLSAYKLGKFTGPDGAERLEPWAPGELLIYPDFEIVAEENESGFPALEFLLNESEGNEWIWRKNREVRSPKSQVGMLSAEGIPFLGPEIVLLFKSQHITGGAVNEQKDQADFDEIRDTLEFERRSWLKTTLETHYPDHPWIASL